MRPDLLDPLDPVGSRLFAAFGGITRRSDNIPPPIREWVDGPNSGPERCSGCVFGLKTVTAPVPGGTIGGETRKVYLRGRPQVNRPARSDPARSASGKRSIDRSPELRKSRRSEPLSSG